MNAERQRLAGILIINDINVPIFIKKNKEKKIMQMGIFSPLLFYLSTQTH